MDDSKFCIKCGKKIPKTADFCQFCGGNQGSFAETKQNTDNIKAEKRVQNDNIFEKSETDSHDKPYNESDVPGLVASGKLYLKDTLKVNKRMGRADFWWGQLFVSIVSSAIVFVLGVIQNANFGGPLGYVEVNMAGEVTANGGASIFILVLIFIMCVFLSICGLTACVRRLHDIGYSGWLWLLTFVPFGYIALIVLECMPSVQRGNRYINY